MLSSQKLEGKRKFTFKDLLRRIKKALTNETFLYIMKRIFSSLLTLLLVVALVSLLLRLIPDIQLYDVAQYNKIKGSNPSGAEAYRNLVLYRYGRTTLDGHRRSAIFGALQYIYWLLPIPKKIPIRWDVNYTEIKLYWEGYIYLGRSIMYPDKEIPVIIKERMGISMRISMITVVCVYVLAYPLGLVMAKKPGGVVDRLGTAFIVLNYAIPGLVFYLLMNSIMGKSDGIFGWMNAGFFYDEHNSASLIPPIFCMVFLSIPGTSMWVRRFTVDELNSDYVKFAKSKGLSENRIMYTHVLRNSVVPLVRSIPGTLLFSFVGSYYVEKIWSIPGTGGLLTGALMRNDFQLIQGLTMIYAALSMLAFLLGDIITVFFDPRIRLRAR
ncbi:MAG TPA: ABC transporter permease [Bacilli bacterium]|nr:ABC transporter permease [Bacilli bacterium]